MVAPLLVGAGAAVVSGLGYLTWSWLKPHTTIVKPKVGPNGTTPTISTDPTQNVIPPIVPVKPPPPQALGNTSGGNSIIIPDPTNTEAYYPAKNGIAIPQAHALYDFLVKNGPHSDGTDNLTNLTTAFQAMHNTDKQAVFLTAETPLKVNGQYDSPTSTALSMYTGHPIPPNSAAPPDPPMTPSQITDPSRTAPVTSTEANSSFNLNQYLLVHGNDKSSTLKQLVKTFQHDVNTDPVFPGPANFANLHLIKTPLVEDGIYGQGTYQALLISTPSAVKP